jgi:surface antigen
LLAALAFGLLVVAGGVWLLSDEPAASELTANSSGNAATAGADLEETPAAPVESGTVEPGARLGNESGQLRQPSGSLDREGGQLREPAATLGSDDGQLSEVASPFDLSLPAISKLDPALLDAVQQAARDASEDGVNFVVTSGWRSPAYQQQLLDDAIVQYGSVEEARRYVATPQTSAHVTGHAVDIGPTDADSWLSQYGIDYGLCQTYANEMWHFELATTPGGDCPTMRSDASS